MLNNDPYKKRKSRSGGASRKQDIRPQGGNRENEADRVIAAFEEALAAGGDPELLLKEWVKKHPAHRTDLAHAASAFSAQAPVEARSEDIPSSLIDKVVAEVAIPSGAIHEQARRSGIAFPEGLAELMRVSPAFLERLQRHEIDSGTIPKLFSARMAEVLNMQMSMCIRMFRGESRFRLINREGKQVYRMRTSFEQVLRESVSPEDVEYWLEKLD
jgi:hypothetical protein